MQFKKVLNELQAEITKNQKGEPVVMQNKIFINGNVPKSTPPEWVAVLKEIKAALIRAKLIDKFTKDADPVDISGLRAQGDIQLQSDDGEAFVYNVESKKLRRA